MRAGGLWHPRLAGLVAALGHTETLVLADAGLPVPPGVETIDLVWARGEPRLLPVLRTVLAELVVESASIAAELGTGSWAEELRNVLADRPVKEIPHEDLKQACAGARAIVRTGEDTAYANVVLHGGVAF
jgi:D-ribose pyranase